MTTRIPEDHSHVSADLLQSLQGSLGRLRKQAEDLIRQLETGAEADLAHITRQVAAAEGLVRTCLKVEASLVEQRDRAGRTETDGYDLEELRSEIGRRLARLRTAGDTGEVPG